MFEKLKAWWSEFKYSLTINRCPVQTEQEAIEEARKRLMALLYPDKKEN
jgi:hypothetical protein